MQRPSRDIEQSVPRGCRFDALVGPLEQLRAQRRLELTHALADGSGRDVAALGGGSDRPLFDDADEEFEGGGIDPHVFSVDHSPPAAINRWPALCALSDRRAGVTN